MSEKKLVEAFNKIDDDELPRLKSGKVDLDKFFKKKTMTLPKGKNYNAQLEAFGKLLMFIQENIDFKVSSRGWTYLLEGWNLITKGEFDKGQEIINKCRKRGYLPIDFVLEDGDRKFKHVIEGDERSPHERMIDFLRHTAHNIWSNHDLEIWRNEEYYIQMLVEKKDLISLFEPVIKKYKIPISNAKGWSDITQRADMVKRFKKYEQLGCKPVLLYCGDLDPFGVAISEKLKKNLNDLSMGTGWRADHLIIDRFGLNIEFIEKHNITWVDNLETGAGKQPDENNPIVYEYIEKYGRRKVEANAIVARYDEARELCEDAIKKYLGDEGLERIENKEQELEDEYREVIKKYKITEAIDPILKTMRFDLNNDE